MRHFVRFARVSANGSLDGGGWRLRIFQNSREARAFARNLPGGPWRIETGAYDDRELVAAASAMRRWRAEIARRLG